MTRQATRRSTTDRRASSDVAELVNLEVGQIQPYEHNPRRAPNAEYDRIKASIRADGLSQPLVVTQRPGEEHHIVHAGGNTRLQILKELSEETGDPRFTKVHCVIRPWTGEADVLLAHLKENDLRGDLTFFDKAQAVADAKPLLEEATGESLTQAQLADALSQSGYGLSQGLISQMTYAVERLGPLLSQALESGLGRPQVAKIRSLERATRAIWIERSVDTETEYDATFEALCRRYDGPEWDIANLRRALEAEIAERAERNLHAVSLEIDARLSGRGHELFDREAPAQLDDCYEEATESEQKVEDESIPADPPNETIPTKDTQPLPDPAEPHVGDALANDDQTSEDRNADEIPPLTMGSPARVDVKSLRARLWTLATRLAQRNGVGDLVQQLPSHGLGFLLRDVPDAALVDQLDEDALAQVSMVWWYLAACSELTVAPLDALLPAIPDDAVLRRALVEQDAGLLFASVWTLDPGHMGYRLWRRLDDRDWQDLLSLMDTYRTLRRRTTVDDQALWKPA